MNASVTPSLVEVMLNRPDDQGAHLTTLRQIVAQRIDETSSARDVASLSRVLLDVEKTIHALGIQPTKSPVDELRAKRTARGAK